jgi:hypothetical protein
MRTDGRTEMTQQTVAFRIFANTPKNQHPSRSCTKTIRISFVCMFAAGCTYSRYNIRGVKVVAINIPLTRIYRNPLFRIRKANRNIKQSWHGQDVRQTSKPTSVFIQTRHRLFSATKFLNIEHRKLY